MKIEVVAKNIKYGFDEQSETYKYVRSVAERTASELYRSEQEFQKEEYEAMLADGDVSSYREYCDAVGISSTDVDYSKPFSENLSHPQIRKQVDALTTQYMCNVLDLPKNAVVEIPPDAFHGRCIPNENAVLPALKEKFPNVTINGYENAATAEKKDILGQNAYEKVGEMIKSGDFQSYLDLRASIGKYSSSNISLIYLQKPDAKAVMGFNAWKRFDRHVNSGQNGISIWQPCRRELRTEEQVDNYIKSCSNQYGKPDSDKAVRAKERLMAEIEEKGKAEVGIGFKLGTVFDIYQTSSNSYLRDNLTDIINLNKPLLQDMENYNDIVASMKDAATLSAFRIRADLPQQEALWEAVYAYADKLLADTPDKVNGIKSPDAFEGDMHTIETTMSAYLICAHIGIECADKAGLRLAEIFNNDQLTEQSVTVGKREMFLKSFDRACCVSDQFNKAFDKSFGYDLEEQREKLAKEIKERAEREEAERKTKSENRVYFGKTPMQKRDIWESNGSKYLIAQHEENGAYYVRVFPDATKYYSTYIKNDEGKAQRFDAPPTRDTVEELYEQQCIAAELSKDTHLHQDDVKTAASTIVALKDKKKTVDREER